jgi:hypothetical protein
MGAMSAKVDGAIWEPHALNGGNMGPAQLNGAVCTVWEPYAPYKSHVYHELNGGHMGTMCAIWKQCGAKWETDGESQHAP